MLHISCGTDEARCFELAGQQCPQGYQYVPTAATQHPDDHNLFVRCNQAAPPAPGAPRPGQSYTTYPQPAPAPSVPAPSGVDVGY